jgi:hypothetical protein
LNLVELPRKDEEEDSREELNLVELPRKDRSSKREKRR